MAGGTINTDKTGFNERLKRIEAQRAATRPAEDHSHPKRGKPRRGGMARLMVFIMALGMVMGGGFFAAEAGLLDPASGLDSVLAALPMK